MTKQRIKVMGFRQSSSHFTYPITCGDGVDGTGMWKYRASEEVGAGLVTSFTVAGVSVTKSSTCPNPSGFYASWLTDNF